MDGIVYKTVLCALFTFSFGALSSQEIHIEGTKFVHPIVEKWIVEYKKENPGSTVGIKTDQVKDGKTFGLNVITHPLSDSQSENDKVIYVGRYALLPVSNANNPLLEKAAKGLKKKDLINLIFEKDVLDENYDPDEKSPYSATVYTRGSESSTAAALSDYFDQTPGQIKGKKIFGDEIYLLNAVQKDETGITFNTLNYVFDLTSRQLKPGISLVPLQLKSKQKEALNSNNIDVVISLLEESKIETIPVEDFGLQIPEAYFNNKEVVNFISWVLGQGQKFNHEYGFLSLDNETISFQKSQLAGNNKGYLSYSE
jgi:ABC-type phosphate transport system substrate-binding protein